MTVSARCVWKYSLVPAALVYRMPRGARLLHVDFQEGQLTVWALVDPLNDKCDHRVVVVGTGEQHPDTDMRYVGTATLPLLGYVLHVFDGGDVAP